MKKGEEVVLFTLVDLFVQLMFFGLILFAAIRVNQETKKGEGIGPYTIINDSLTTLIAKGKRQEASLDSARAAARVDSAKIAELRDSIATQYGLPPCGGQARYIASVVVSDDIIVMTRRSPKMDSLLTVNLKRDPESVRRLSPEAFRAAFAPLTRDFPKCRYFIQMERRNRLEEPVIAVHSAFRTQLRTGGP